jgi:glycosyltransferase involved in cell wall biosynthesis
MASLSIGIDYRPALSRSTGVGRYVSGLVGALARIDRQNDYVLFSSSLRQRAEPGPLPSNFHFVDRRIPVSLLNTLWHRLGRPRLDALAGRSFDISHSPHPLILPSRGRTVVTIHDLFFYRHSRGTTAEIRRDYAPLVKSHASRADAIVTPSLATKEEVVRLLEVGEGKIQVTPLGIDTETFRPRPREEEELAQRYRLPPRYVLAVASLEPRKNLARLVEAVGLLVRRGWDGTLLLAGGSDRDESRIERAIDDQQLGERVRRLGYVPFQHLPAIYRRARVLANVSLWEGFGLPVLEAMACQVPVVASDIPSHHEVAADGAFYVDADRPDSIAQGIERVWEDEPLRKNLIEQAQMRLPLFSWDETARRTLALYERLGPK